MTTKKKQRHRRMQHKNLVTNCSDVWVKNENIDVQCTLYIGIGRWHQCLHHTDWGSQFCLSCNLRLVLCLNLFLHGNVDWCWFLLVGADWFWLRLLDADWCCLMIDADFYFIDWCSLILIDADWWWFILIDAHWSWLMLNDADWFWLKLNQLMPIVSDWC